VKVFHRLLAPILGMGALTIAACTDRLESSGACPLLCPGEGVQVQNIVLEPVTLDTAVSSVTGIGNDLVMLFAKRGDTLETRLVVRFDSLPARYRPVSSDTTTLSITVVDSARIRLRFDTTAAKLPSSVTIEAYNVDTTAADTVTAAILALFRPDRLIGSQQFTGAELKDSVYFPISNAAVLARITDRNRLRLGFRIVAAGPTQMRVFASASGLGPSLSFRPSTDTAIAKITVNPFSKTPSGDQTLASDLRDYIVYAHLQSTGVTPMLEVGGVPGVRSYLRFDIPGWLIDSTGIVRAELILTQTPASGLDVGDTLAVVPQVVAATTLVTDPELAAQVVYSAAISGGDSIRTAPRDSGQVVIDIARILRLWRGIDVDEVPRALVLRTTSERLRPGRIRFFSSEAESALRPRLRISYTINSGAVLP
jgi:hypothetical protein